MADEVSKLLRDIQKRHWEALGIEPETLINRQKYPLSNFEHNFDHSFLEEKKESVPWDVAFPREEREAWDKWANSILSEKVDDWDDYVENLRKTNPYEEPKFFRMLKPLYDDAKEIASKFDLHIPCDTFFGTISDAAPNAFAAKIPGATGSVIGFNRGTARMINEIFRVKQHIFLDWIERGVIGFNVRRPVNTAAEVRRTLRKRKDIGDFITAVFIRLFVLKNFQSSMVGPSYNLGLLLDKEQSLRAIEFFIISHEIAHISLGHLDGRQEFPSSVEMLREITDLVCPVTDSERIEVEADVVGLFLTYQWIIRKEMPVTVAIACMSAVSFLFTVLSFCDKLYSSKAFSGALSARGGVTHPSPTERHRLCQELFAGFAHIGGADWVHEDLSERNAQDLIITREVFRYFMRRCQSAKKIKWELSRLKGIET